MCLRLIFSQNELPECHSLLFFSRKNLGGGSSMRDNFIVNKDFTGLPFGFQGAKFLTVQDSALSWSPASVSSKSESHSVLCNSATQNIQSMEFSRPEYWSGEPFPSPGDRPKQGIKPKSLTLQENSLPPEPQGKPKNSRVGSLSLLQGIFPTHKSKWGLLHCRWILY